MVALCGATMAAGGRVSFTSITPPARRAVHPRVIAARRMQGAAAAVAVRALKDGDLLFAATEKEQGMWLEVQGSKVDAAYAHAAGYELRIDNPDDLSAATAALLGRVALPKELWSRVRQSMGDEAVDALKSILTLPELQPGSTVKLSDLQQKYSSEQLWAAVAADAAPWTDGAEAMERSDLPTELAAAVGQAGELVSLLQGKRGVCLVQLWTVKDGDNAGAVYNPMALRVLRQALQDPAVSFQLSYAETPDGPLGLTAVVAAAVEPYASWASYLARMGVQSALVPDSAFDKVLIGRMLGYPDAAIAQHVQSKGQQVDQVLMGEVQQALIKLSDVAPALPWRTDAPHAMAAGHMTAVSLLQQVKTGFGGGGGGGGKANAKVKGKSKSKRAK